MCLYLSADGGGYLVYVMCRWARVSRAGYHEVAEPGFIRDASSARGEVTSVITGLLPRVWPNLQVCRRIHAALVEWGVHASSGLVRQLHVPGWPSWPTRPRKAGPHQLSQPRGLHHRPDLVKQDCRRRCARGRNEVGEVSLHPRSWEGFAYLATVMDCYPR